MIVSNSTPLIAFARIGRLPLLQTVVGKIVIPEAVAVEVSQFAGQLGRIELAHERWISVQQVQSERDVHLLLSSLDQGEAEVIVLAIEQQARLVLIDELAARKVAQSLQLNITGSVGILIAAKQMGIITAVRPLLDAMIRNGIRYSQRFVISVLLGIGEAS